jgi:hypothetical protein
MVFFTIKRKYTTFWNMLMEVNFTIILKKLEVLTRNKLVI